MAADTENKSLARPDHDSSNWDTPLNSNFTIIDTALGEQSNISVVMPGATLTVAQLQCAILHFTGTLTENTEYKVPANVGGFWIVRNDTNVPSGDWTFKIMGNPSDGTDVTIPSGQSRWVYSNGASSPKIYTPDIYGETTEVLFNKNDTIDGDPTFTFDGTNLKVPHIEIKDGSKTAPALRSDTSTKGTGLYFFDADADKGIAFATNDLNRLLINKDGAFGLGDTPAAFGASGQFLKSMGDAANPVWGDANTLEIDNKPISGDNILVFNPVDLEDFKFLVMVFRELSHNSTGDTRTFHIGSTALENPISKAVSHTQAINGFAIIHLVSRIGFTSTGNDNMTENFSYGLFSSINNNTTQIRVGFGGGGTMDGSGRVYLLGIY